VSTRSLLAAGIALAVLSLGLPWGSYAGTPSYLTTGYYLPGYCDNYYCYGGYYVPGQIFFGYEGGTFPGTWSSARFFIVGAFALGVLGWRLSSTTLLRAGAVVAALGVLTHLTAGLTGGALCLGAAAACFWLAARRLDRGDVIRTVETGAPSV
jgi:hypothetical protein